MSSMQAAPWASGAKSLLPFSYPILTHLPVVRFKQLLASRTLNLLCPLSGACLSGSGQCGKRGGGTYLARPSPPQTLGFHHCLARPSGQLDPQDQAARELLREKGHMVTHTGTQGAPGLQL